MPRRFMKRENKGNPILPTVWVNRFLGWFYSTIGTLNFP
ncbi:hypothetical protein HMPREF9964_1339 [Streptococcus dysgalactiae subsp. equisimilis SK1249]|nr:hypothetical protein HMPREF9964_1339 [Streptococcus dysgalactiae subsp. equisimilis SK1249]